MNREHYYYYKKHLGSKTETISEDSDNLNSTNFKNIEEQKLKNKCYIV